MGFVGLGLGRFGGHLGDRGGRAACRNEGATYASWSLPRSSQAMARAITFVSIQGVVNFLTLRPAPLLVCHMGSHPLVTRSIPLSRVHRVENTEYNTRNIPGHLPDSVGRRLDYSELFCRFLCHRVRFPARTCVIGVCRALQKTASKRVTPSLFLSLSQLMSFSSRSAARALRSVSRRAPRSLTQQSASYSLLAARTAAVTAKLPQRAAFQVRAFLSCPRKHAR